MNFGYSADLVAYILVAATRLIAVVTQLAASGKIRRNGFIGLRIPPTMASDAGWTAGHQAARIPVWSGFAVITITAVVAQFVPISDVVFFAMLLLTLTWSVVAAWRGAGSAVD